MGLAVGIEGGHNGLAAADESSTVARKIPSRRSTQPARVPLGRSDSSFSHVSFRFVSKSKHSQAANILGQRPLLTQVTLDEIRTPQCSSSLGKDQRSRGSR